MSTQNLFKRTGAGNQPTHLKVMVSGPPKSGKTSLLGTVPGILVLDTEPQANNLESIAHLNVPYVTITNTDDLRQVAFMLGDDTLRKQIASQYGLPDIQAVAIDTLDTLQKIMKKERLREQKSSVWTRDDWGWLKTEMEAIVQTFTALKMHVFFMVHTKTKELGKGDDSYTIVLPGLEGGISEDIAGMVGYSLLAFRKEEVSPTGEPETKYWLRTEGDRTYDFLGTRTAGRLPTIIEPHMKRIYDAVIEGRKQAAAAQAAQAAAASATQAPPPTAPAGESTPSGEKTEEVAQNEGREDAPTGPVQTDVETPAPAPEATPEAERPADDQPISPAAMGHVKRVYDALEVRFPQEVIEKVTIGDARAIVKMWRAVQEDHSEGKANVGVTPQSEMQEYLQGQGWWSDDSEKPQEKTVEAKVDGTIDEVLAYVQDDLAKVQEAFDLEAAKDKPRKGLIEKLEGLGAKQTPVQNATPATPSAPPTEAVTPTPEAADTPPTEDEAIKTVEERLGAETVSEDLREDAPCSVCGKPIDDYDLAKLGLKRFQKVLCVQDYLAEIRN